MNFRFPKSMAAKLIATLIGDPSNVIDYEQAARFKCPRAPLLFHGVRSRFLLLSNGFSPDTPSCQKLFYLLSNLKDLRLLRLFTFHPACSSDCLPAGSFEVFFCFKSSVQLESFGTQKLGNAPKCRLKASKSFSESENLSLNSTS